MTMTQPPPNPSKKKRLDQEQNTLPDAARPLQLARRRVWRACEMCRRKKIKCDGVEPTCSQCQASKSDCTWQTTKDRAAHSRHQVQELQTCYAYALELLQLVRPCVKQAGPSQGVDPAWFDKEIASLPTISGTGPSSSNLPVISESGQNAGDGEQNEYHYIKAEEDDSEASGQLARDEYGHQHWLGYSSTLSLVNSFRELTIRPHLRVSPMEDDPNAPGPNANKLYFPASVWFGKVRAMPRPEEVEYPERDLADRLVNTYFEVFHHLMPLLDKPSFIHRYQFIMEHQHQQTAQEIKKQTPFVALIFSVFAVAARLVDDPRLRQAENLDDAGMGMVYYERALILHHISHASMQVEHVQCFTLLSSFLCSVNCLPQAWIVVGQAVRAAQEIGLHRSPRKLDITPIEKETRRKIFWSVYTLDRMLAMTLGRPLAIADVDCDVEMPVDVDDEDLPMYFSGAALPEKKVTLMRGFRELIELYKIAGQVLRRVYALDKCRDNLEPDKRAELLRSVEEIDQALTDWCKSIPAAYNEKQTDPKQLALASSLSNHYYHILTTLHRNFLPVRKGQALHPTDSTRKVLAAARSCIKYAPTLRGSVPLSHHFAFLIQSVFSSAVIVLLWAMNRHDDALVYTTLMGEAGICLKVFESWEGLWPGARKCKELLEDCVANTNEAIRAAANAPPNASSGPHPNVHSVPASSSASPPRAAAISVQVSDRLIKNRPRRNRSTSRDVAQLSPRQAHAASQFRADALSLRARSTSRKRPHDEDLYEDRYGLPGSYPGRSNLSAHGSPVSANSHPSPPSQSRSGSRHRPAQSPQTMHLEPNMFSPLNMVHSPTVQIPSSNPQSQLEFDFNSGGWTSPTAPADDAAFNFYQQQQYTASGFSPTLGPLDGPYNGMSFDGNIDPSLVYNPGFTNTTPPSSAFSAKPREESSIIPGEGLPWPGYRSLVSGELQDGPMIDTEPNQFWPTADGNQQGGFGGFDALDPVPFALADLVHDPAIGGPWHGQGQ